jgi:hypothetical protein
MLLGKTKLLLKAAIELSDLTVVRSILHFYGQLVRAKVLSATPLLEFMTQALNSPSEVSGVFWVSAVSYVIEMCADALNDQSGFSPLWTALEAKTGHSKPSVLRWSQGVSMVWTTQDSTDLHWTGLAQLRKAGWVCNYSPVYFKSDSSELAEYSFDPLESSPKGILAPVLELLPIRLPLQDFAALHTTIVDVFNSFRHSPDLASEKLIKLYSPHDLSEVIVNVRPT